jgi:Rieske Fe-S protein
MGTLTDWINGGRLDLLLDAILVDTAVIGAAGAGLTAIPWNAVWDAEVQSEVQDAIEANHLDHLLAVDYDPASKPGTATALLNELVESDGGVSRYTANALEQGAGGGTTNVRQESSFLQGGKS